MPARVDDGCATPPAPPEPLDEQVEVDDPKARAMTLKVAGNEAMKNEEYDIAIEKYSEAIDLHEDATFYCNRAYMYVLTKQHEAAVSDATRAIALKPDYWRAFVRKVQALHHLKRYGDVLATIQEVCVRA